MNDVTTEHYLEMIRLKTSVLLACSCAMGAISAGASQERVELWYKFGEQTGLAFQIQDDLLDTFGDSEITGKKVGGDILSEKKTFIWLYTKAKGMLPENLSSCLESTDKISLVSSAMIASVRATWLRCWTTHVRSTGRPCLHTWRRWTQSCAR